MSFFLSVLSPVESAYQYSFVSSISALLSCPVPCQKYLFSAIHSWDDCSQTWKERLMLAQTAALTLRARQLCSCSESAVEPQAAQAPDTISRKRDSRSATSFPGPTPLSKWRTDAEKTLAYTGRPPAKYSKNLGVFCHVTFNRISPSLHLISGPRNKNGQDFASI